MKNIYFLKYDLHFIDHIIDFEILETIKWFNQSQQPFYVFNCPREEADGEYCKISVLKMTFNDDEFDAKVEEIKTFFNIRRTTFEESVDLNTFDMFEIISNFDENDIWKDFYDEKRVYEDGCTFLLSDELSNSSEDLQKEIETIVHED